MQVVRTVVPGALLLDPALPTERPRTVTTSDRMPVRRRRRPPHGAVYGLHGHRWEPTLLEVPRGTGYAVVVDTRPSAETFGRLAATMLEGSRALLVPPGCLYGVQSVARGTLVRVRSAARPTRRDHLVADPDDPELRIRWLCPRPSRVPAPGRSWAALCLRLDAPSGPRRDRVMLW